MSLSFSLCFNKNKEATVIRTIMKRAKRSSFSTNKGVSNMMIKNENPKLIASLSDMSNFLNWDAIANPGTNAMQDTNSIYNQ